MKTPGRIFSGVLVALVIVFAPATPAHADECSGLLGCVVEGVVDVVERIVAPAEPQPVPPAPQPSQPAPQPSQPAEPAPAPPAAPQTPVEEPAAPSGGGEPSSEPETAETPDVEVQYTEDMLRPTSTPGAEPEVDLQYDRDSVIPFLPEDKIQRQGVFWWVAGAALFFTAISLGALFAWLELRKNRKLL